MQEFLQQVAEISPIWLYAAVGLAAFLENIFPPLPSDVAVLAGGSFVAMGDSSFAIMLASAVIGSTAGFMTMYKIGHWFGDRILEAGKIRFLPIDQVHRVEKWFRKYGYGIVIANRFLSGTRAVVSFFAGMSELSLPKTALLSFLSALLWNSILLVAGKELGQNWEKITSFLQAYSQAVTSAIIVGILILIARYLYRRSNGGKSRARR